MNLSTRSLFGGAISISLPSNFLDTSDFRQVPDNQEAFVDSNNEDSIIIELLEMVNSSDLEALRVHFEDLAETNEAIEHSINVENELPKLAQIRNLKTFYGFSCNHSVCYAIGTQKVSKYNYTQAKDYKNIHIYMVLIRLFDQKTDMLITMNYPQDPTLSSVKSESHQPPEILLNTIVSTLNVHNWNLFC
ncbi:hypothetical protein BB558_004117 [Smittium angustum]|uniref:Ran guanine nucleotide release factor n=1 Tax=Smittium angustum TaxID=133377 RepID=A0A2U1J4D1_SMIAN|nr:hypothetical protein BB558_004117 [Smittium angustum]